MSRFSHKHAELTARIQDTCQERRETPSSDTRAIRSLHRCSPGPGKPKPSSRQGPLRLAVIRWGHAGPLPAIRTIGFCPSEEGIQHHKSNFFKKAPRRVENIIAKQEAQNCFFITGSLFCFVPTGSGNIMALGIIQNQASPELWVPYLLVGG